MAITLGLGYQLIHPGWTRKPTSNGIPTTAQARQWFQDFHHTLLNFKLDAQSAESAWITWFNQGSKTNQEQKVRPPLLALSKDCNSLPGFLKSNDVSPQEFAGVLGLSGSCDLVSPNPIVDSQTFFAGIPTAILKLQKIGAELG
jgi:hypothetical protein